MSSNPENILTETESSSDYVEKFETEAAEKGQDIEMASESSVSEASEKSTTPSDEKTSEKCKLEETADLPRDTDTLPGVHSEALQSSVEPEEATNVEEKPEISEQNNTLVSQMHSVQSEVSKSEELTSATHEISQIQKTTEVCQHQSETVIDKYSVMEKSGGSDTVENESHLDVANVENNISGTSKGSGFDTTNSKKAENGISMQTDYENDSKDSETSSSFESSKLKLEIRSSEKMAASEHAVEISESDSLTSTSQSQTTDSLTSVTSELPEKDSDKISSSSSELTTTSDSSKYVDSSKESAEPSAQGKKSEIENRGTPEKAENSELHEESGIQSLTQSEVKHELKLGGPSHRSPTKRRVESSDSSTSTNSELIESEMHMPSKIPRTDFVSFELDESKNEQKPGMVDSLSKNLKSMYVNVPEGEPDSIPLKKPAPEVSSCSTEIEKLTLTSNGDSSIKSSCAEESKVEDVSQSNLGQRFIPLQDKKVSELKQSSLQPSDSDESQTDSGSMADISESPAESPMSSHKSSASGSGKSPDSSMQSAESTFKLKLGESSVQSSESSVSQRTTAKRSYPPTLGSCSTEVRKVDPKNYSSSSEDEGATGNTARSLESSPRKRKSGEKKDPSDSKKKRYSR